jgi:hypothetical protein
MKTAKNSKCPKQPRLEERGGTPWQQAEKEGELMQRRGQQIAEKPDNQQTEHQNIMTPKQTEGSRNQSSANIAKDHAITAIRITNNTPSHGSKQPMEKNCCNATHSKWRRGPTTNTQNTKTS